MTYFAGLHFLHSSSGNEASDLLEGVYSLHFCRAGCLWWSMNGSEPRLLSAPLAWWTLPSHTYSFEPETGEGEWEHFEVRFSGARADAMLQGGLIQDNPLEPHLRVLPDMEAFERTFAQLGALLARGEIEQLSPLAHARAALLLEELLLSLCEGGASLAPLSPLEEAVAQWLEEVRVAPHKPWNITEDAARLAISEGHFRRLVRKFAGVSPHRFVLDRRLDAGAARLRTTKDPIKSLAPACGFEDVNHFTRLFTARFHLPPASYRRANRMMAQETARLRRRKRWTEEGSSW